MLGTLCVIALMLLLAFLKRKYFTLYGSIPGSPPTFLLGNIIESGQLFGGASLTQVLRLFKNRFGDTFQLWIGPFRFVVVGNIKDVQHIFSNRNIYDQGDAFVERASVIFPNGLICLRGPPFKRHAAVTIPLFRRTRIVNNLDLIVEFTDKWLDILRKKPPGMVHTDMVKQTQNLLMAIFGYIGYDYNLRTLDDNDNDAAAAAAANDKEFAEALYNMMATFELIFYSPRFVSILYTKYNKRYRNARAIIEKNLNQIVEKELNLNEESRAERKRTCLLASLVLSLQKDEQQEEKKPEGEKKGLSKKEIIDEALLFLVAGYETTATALAWSIYHLSKYPDEQTKIKAELTERGLDRPLTLDYLDSLVYLDCFIKEVFRMTPPVPGTQRTLTCDDRLPETGYWLRKGETVLIPFSNLSYDSRYWNMEPEKFYPGRFLNEDKDHPSYAWLPFGSGHRQCIGQDLARFELKVILARLMQFLTFGDGGPELNAGGHKTSVTVMPKKVGVTIEFD